MQQALKYLFQCSSSAKWGSVGVSLCCLFSHTSQFIYSQFAVPVITSLPQSCGIHTKVTSLLWVRGDLITWLAADKSRSFFSHDNFANIFVLFSSPEGDESGTVALVDTKNPDSALSSTVHARNITGFAFSTHRYSLIYWHRMCDYIHLGPLFGLKLILKPPGFVFPLRNQ